MPTKHQYLVLVLQPCYPHVGSMIPLSLMSLNTKHSLYFIICEDRMNKTSLKEHLVEGPVTSHHA